MGMDSHGGGTEKGFSVQQSSNQRRNSMKPITAILVTALAVVPCAPGCVNQSSTDRLSYSQAFESPDAVIRIRGVS